MQKLLVIIEKGNDELYGRIEGHSSFLPVTCGSSQQEVFSNLRELIKDYQQQESSGDAFWLKLNVDKLEFEVAYDLQAFFSEHDFLNAAAIARQAGMNENLVSQYASGEAYSSLEHTKIIEATIRKLTKQLQAVSLVSEP